MLGRLVVGILVAEMLMSGLTELARYQNGVDRLRAVRHACAGRLRVAPPACVGQFRVAH